MNSSTIKLNNRNMPNLATTHFMIPDEVFINAYHSHLVRYIFASKLIPGNSVLDVACGSGYGSKVLSESGKEVIAGDISKDAIRYAKRQYSENGIHFILINATNMPFRNTCLDAIISMETIEHIVNVLDFLGEIKRLLKTGGIFICSTPNFESRPPFIAPNPPCHIHVKEFSPNELYCVLSQFFGDIELYGQNYRSRPMYYTKWIMNKAFDVIGRLLIKFPTGDIIKNTVKKLLRIIQNSNELGLHHNYNCQDNYQNDISLLKHSFWKVPGNIIAVCRNNKVNCHEI